MKEFVEIWLKTPDLLEDERCKDISVIKEGKEALADCMKAFLKCYEDDCMYIQLTPPCGLVATHVQDARAKFVQDELPLRAEGDPPVRVAPNKLVYPDAEKSHGPELGRGLPLTGDPLPTSKASPTVINTGLKSDRLP